MYQALPPPPTEGPGYEASLVGAYLHLKSEFLTIIGCCEVVPNLNIGDFQTLLYAEAL